MKDESWRRNHGKESRRMNHERGIVEGEACKRNHGRGIIWKHQELSGRHLGSIWEASRSIKEEASGSIWGYLGSLWEASWRHLGGIWGTQGIWRHRGGPLKQEVHLPSLKCNQTAASDHSTAEWRRSDAQSTVKHTVLARAPHRDTPATPIANTVTQAARNPTVEHCLGKFANS